jgi:hypothetical protein
VTPETDGPHRMRLHEWHRVGDVHAALQAAHTRAPATGWPPTSWEMEARGLGHGRLGGFFCFPGTKGGGQKIWLAGYERTNANAVSVMQGLARLLGGGNPNSTGGW